MHTTSVAIPTRADLKITGRSQARPVSPVQQLLDADHRHRLGFARALPKGRWFAYVQHVKLNAAGHADGEVTYWLVADGKARGGKRVADERHIVWRTVDGPESAINELWANVFCGGTNCGHRPWPRSTIALRRLTVTEALPDLERVQGELDALNAAAAQSE